jgi:N-acetylmuramoyl-L-alanine amidase
VSNTSHDQSTNLHIIVNWHNSRARDFDVSTHFNAYTTTTSPMGHRVPVCDAILLGGPGVGGDCRRRRPHRPQPEILQRFVFLNKTREPAILIETCFVDSRADADLYEEHLSSICAAIAETISGQSLPDGGSAPSGPNAPTAQRSQPSPPQPRRSKIDVR